MRLAMSERRTISCKRCSNDCVLHIDYRGSSLDIRATKHNRWWLLAVIAHVRRDKRTKNVLASSSFVSLLWMGCGHVSRERRLRAYC